MNKQTHVQHKPSAQTSLPHTSSRFLQQKCGCGKSTGLTRTCSECGVNSLASSTAQTNRISQPIIHEALGLPEQTNATEQDTDDSDANSDKSVIRCSNDVSFHVNRFRLKLRDKFKPKLGFSDDGKGSVDVRGSTLNLVSLVRTAVESETPRKVAKSWTLGFIQNVTRDKITLKYSDPSNRDSIIDCAEYRQDGVKLDCDNNNCQPFYDCSTKQAYARLPRRLAMTDTPSVEQIRLVNGDRSVLKSFNRNFEAKAYLVASNASSPCVLKTVSWGFVQNNVFSPRIVPGIDGLTATALGSVQQSISSIGPFELDQNGGQSPQIDGPCASQAKRSFLDCEEGGQTVDSSENPTLRQANAIEQEQQQIDHNEDSLSTALSDQDTKQAIDEYNGCSGTATIECRGGEIVASLPPCLENAPCGIRQCVERHERSHAKDYADWYKTNLDGFPCKHPDGKAYPDGSTVFVNEVATEMGRSKYKRWLNRSECRGYGEEIRCYRELRKKSQDRRCKKALTKQSAGAVPKRIGFCLGINSAGPR
ncbi:hypothetical protein Lepto7375DRAFT_2521 [Leptolyngbya sp. PCC 7375]|nr:hypothetical protein Lepto7375DRAFT_2521 [Leptolyngbya sp. PCC 7375]